MAPGRRARPPRLRAVEDAFAELGRLGFEDGYVLGGAAAALRTPQEWASWPLFVDPPGCWLHDAGGTVRGSWPAGKATWLAAFPFPAADPAYSSQVRGRVLTLVVFHDRPEVRRLLEFVLGHEGAAPASAELAQAGIWLVGAVVPDAGPDGVTGPEGELLRNAIRSGTFRVSASDLMPASVAAAFRAGTVDLLAWGPGSMRTILDDIQRSWTNAK